MLSRSININIYYLFRRVGNGKLFSNQAVLPELDETIKSDIENEKIKPRKHPGVMKIPGFLSLPEDIVNAIKIFAEDHPIATILTDAKVLANYLHSRHYPWEEEDLRERRSEFYDDVKDRMGSVPEEASDEQVQHYNRVVKTAVAQLMQKYNYKWSALDLHDYSCAVYLFTRAAPNYIAVRRVFHEINLRCPDFRPTSLFDFGSGVGSVTWAAKFYWADSLKQFMNIDSSSSMNELAELLLKGCNREETRAPNIHYREFLPAQHMKYSLVVSAHSLMELPSRESRLKVLLNLWNKTDDFLVIVEQGTKPGFKVVVEARDFVLSLSNEDSPAHVFAPCPHDVTCPRLVRGDYPCHFIVSYQDLAVGKKHKDRRELLSYVVIRKGKRVKGKEWPRVVRPILKRNNHVICRLCTAHGDLRECIFTKNQHGKTLYNCAKKSNWGDFLPMTLPPISGETGEEESNVTLPPTTSEDSSVETGQEETSEYECKLKTS